MVLLYYCVSICSFDSEKVLICWLIFIDWCNCWDVFEDGRIGIVINIYSNSYSVGERI